MAGLTDDQINQGVDALVQAQKSPIPGLGDAAWAYLLKFTASHEGVFNYLYNNMGKPNVPNSDVTVGIGISLPFRSSCQGHLNLFYVKGTNFTQKATLPQLEADWDKVNGMSRATYSLDAFARAVTTEIKPEDALQGMVNFMGQTVSGRLNRTEFAKFATWPAQARVALSSYCYGLSTDGAPKMRAALTTGDFDTAGLQSYISVWDENKVRDHRKLFWNAARLLEQRAKNPQADLDQLPVAFGAYSSPPIPVLPLDPRPPGSPAPRPVGTLPP